MNEKQVGTVRFKLTDKQFDAIVRAQRAVAETQAEFQKAQGIFGQVTELVLDAHGLTQDDKVQLDDQTRELVVEVEVEPEDAPAPKKARAK